MKIHLTEFEEDGGMIGIFKAWIYNHRPDEKAGLTVSTPVHPKVLGWGQDSESGPCFGHWACWDRKGPSPKLSPLRGSTQLHNNPTPNFTLGPVESDKNRSHGDG